MSCIFVRYFIFHLIFQHMETPCSPYPIGKAILAKADISDFHYRWGFDVSLPYVPLKQRALELAELAQRRGHLLHVLLGIERVSLCLGGVTIELTQGVLEVFDRGDEGRAGLFGLHGHAFLATRRCIQPHITASRLSGSTGLVT